MNSPCVFCSLPIERILLSNEAGIVIYDGFPISPGHALIISKRHIGSIFELTSEEAAELAALTAEAKELISSTYQPNGYNIGINDGAAAGQTIPHLHIHLIPRFTGDQADPRGGVRWIFPQKADYWSK